MNAIARCPAWQEGTGLQCQLPEWPDHTGPGRHDYNPDNPGFPNWDPADMDWSGLLGRLTQGYAND